jgi:hypothetical protein
MLEGRINRDEALGKTLMTKTVDSRKRNGFLGRE